PSMHRYLGEAGDLVLRQHERHRISRDAGNGVDRNSDLAPPQEVTTLEHDVRDPVTGVDEKDVDMAEPVIVGGEDLAGAADLDVPLRNAVIGDRNIGVEVPGVLTEVGM